MIKYPDLTKLQECIRKTLEERIDKSILQSMAIALGISYEELMSLTKEELYTKYLESLKV